MSGVTQSEAGDDAVDKQGRLTTLLSHSLVYGVGSAVSKVAAILLLPLYTTYLDRADYGTVELVWTIVVAGALIMQLGMVNSFFRYWFDSTDPDDQREVFSTTFWTLILGSTIVVAVLWPFARQLGELALGTTGLDEAALIRIALVGIWMQTNYQLMTGLFRVQQRPVAFSIATLVNLGVTVGLTVTLVTVFDQKAEGLLLGNICGSLIIYAGLLFMQRRWLRPTRALVQLPGRQRLWSMLDYGLPMVPAAAGLWIVNMINRPLISSLEGLAELGVIAIAFKISQGILILVQAFQLSWPAFAHSIEDDDKAREVYARVLVMYTAVMTVAVATLGLMAPWIVRLLTTPQFSGAATAVLPLCIGAALFGGYFVVSIGTNRTKRTRMNGVITAAAGGVEVVLLLLLIPPFGIVGAAWACCGAYFSMFVMMAVYSGRLFSVPYRWGKVAHGLAAGVAPVAVGLAATTGTGAISFAVRTCLALAVPILLLTTGFFTPQERRRISGLVRRRLQTKSAT